MNQELQAFIERQAGAFMPAAILVYDPQFELYLRAGKRVNYDRQVGAIPALCISRIEVNEDLIRTGVMTKLMTDLIEKGRPLGYCQFQVENAWAPNMQAWCKKHNLARRLNSEEPCFFLNF